MYMHNPITLFQTSLDIVLHLTTINNDSSFIMYLFLNDYAMMGGVIDALRMLKDEI